MIILVRQDLHVELALPTVTVSLLRILHQRIVPSGRRPEGFDVAPEDEIRRHQPALGKAMEQIQRLMESGGSKQAMDDIYRTITPVSNIFRLPGERERAFS